MKFDHVKGKTRIRSVVLGILLFLLVAVVGGATYLYKTYQSNLEPVSAVEVTHVFTVEPGATTGQIADKLKAKGVIKSDWAFEWYVRNNQLRDKIKAGTYILSESQSVPEIIDVIVEGKVATDLVTILPGKRIDQIKDDFIEQGFTSEDVDRAFSPDLYADHPALSEKPKDASLEGYIYPESFLKVASTTPEEIIRLALDETELRLTAELRQAITKQGMTLHQGITLASIIEREVHNDDDRAQVAQVFIKRLREGMKLESNATDDYAKLDPSYNTYDITSLPPGPISNVSESSLRAVAFPASTDWTYFVSGDDKTTHFSRTLQEHEANIEKYCTTLCGR